jgi:broad specificity phosphatase PhoE
VAADVQGATEHLGAFWQRSADAWAQLQEHCHRNGGKTVAVVTHSPLISAMLCHCLGLGSSDLSLFRTGGGSITIIDFPDVAQGDELSHGVVRCTNFTAHLGRWAVPVTRDDVEYAVCGIDGCF